MPNSFNSAAYNDDINEIQLDLKEIKKILNGNGKPGLVSKVEHHDEFMRAAIRRDIDMGTFIFRTAVALVLGYIAWKIGLKP